MSDIMPPADPQEEIDALREQIAELQQQLSARAPADTVSELTRQLDAAREELAALRAAAPPSTSPKPSSRRLDGFYEVEDSE